MKQQEISYPWEFCPPGYNYAAVDKSGRAFWYRVKPTKVQEQWAVLTEDVEICYLELGFLNNPPEDFDWEESLQKRPKPLKDGQINYPWHLAPDWAEYAATDENGRAFWYQAKPKLMYTIWGASFGQVLFGNWTPPEDFDWKQSLQKRPNT